jgi:hypothetical protein
MDLSCQCIVLVVRIIILLARNVLSQIKGLSTIETAKGREARHGTLLQSASTPALQAALHAVCWNRRKLIPLGRCNADRESGRSTSRGSFDPEDASFRRVPSHRLYTCKAGTWGSVFRFFGRSLNAHFEKRAPWAALRVVMLDSTGCRGSAWHPSPGPIYSYVASVPRLGLLE